MSIAFIDAQEETGMRKNQNLQIKANLLNDNNAKAFGKANSKPIFAGKANPPQPVLR